MSKYDERFLLTFGEKNNIIIINLILEERKMKKVNSVQKWLPLKKVLNNGIIMLKDFSYV